MKQLLFIIMMSVISLSLTAQEFLIPIAVEVYDHPVTSSEDEQQLAIYFRSHLKQRGFNTDVSESKFVYQLVPSIRSSNKTGLDNVMVRMQIMLKEVESDAILLSANIDTAVYSYIEGWEDGSMDINKGISGWVTYSDETSVLSDYGKCFAYDITQVEQFLAVTKEMLSSFYKNEEKKSE